MKFSATTLRVSLAGIPRAQCWWLAYSGGLDSHCLLHALVDLIPNVPDLCVVHVDHGINSASGHWARHCAAVCEQLQVSYRLLPVQVQPASGESLEAVARSARYCALAQVIGPGDVVITAHHQDDQAETMLLQLLRGAGPRGLAAMPFLMSFHHGYLARPLLGYSRTDLLAYARTMGLAWVEDDSNHDQRYDRNYLRHKVFPLLLQRWPAAAVTLSRSATHQAEAVVLLESLADQDLTQVVGPQSHTLQIVPLLALGPIRARNLLRYWIRVNGHEIPTAAILDRVLQEVVGSRWDATPLITWFATELRRYRDLIYLLPPLHSLPAPSWNLEWTNLHIPLQLSWGILTAVPIIGGGLSASACTNGIKIRLRQGGERCRLAENSHARPLKDIWQAARIPPWERVRIPLLFINAELAAIPGLGVCKHLQASPEAAGWNIEWQFLINKSPLQANL